MQDILICAVDLKPRWTRVVVCTPEHRILEQYAWRTPELSSGLPAVLRGWLHNDLPMVLTGRTEACWPDGLLSRLSQTGVDIDLIGGPPVRTLLHLERTSRENQSFHTASLLAAIWHGRPLGDPLRMRHFLYHWQIAQASQHIENVQSVMATDHGPEWSLRAAVRDPWKHAGDHRVAAPATRRP